MGTVPLRSSSAPSVCRLKEPMDLYTLTLALGPTAIADLRQWLASILETNPVARSSAAEIELAAVEALNSALRHSSNGSSVVVTLSIVGHDVYVRVSDRDAISTDARSGDGRGDEADPAESLGLTLMHGLMDEVDLNETADGTTVRLVKRLRLSDPRAVPALDNPAAY